MEIVEKINSLSHKSNQEEEKGKSRRQSIKRYKELKSKRKNECKLKRL